MTGGDGARDVHDPRVVPAAAVADAHHALVVVHPLGGDGGHVVAAQDDAGVGQEATGINICYCCAFTLNEGGTHSCKAVLALHGAGSTSPRVLHLSAGNMPAVLKKLSGKMSELEVHDV